MEMQCASIDREEGNADTCKPVYVFAAVMTQGVRGCVRIRISPGLHSLITACCSSALCDELRKAGVDSVEAKTVDPVLHERDQRENHRQTGFNSAGN